MLTLIAPWLIAIFAILSGGLLIYRAWLKHDWAIFSEALPRFYLAGAYVWVTLVDMPLVERQNITRLAILIILLIEIIYMLTNKRNRQ